MAVIFVTIEVFQFPMSSLNVVLPLNKLLISVIKDVFHMVISLPKYASEFLLESEDDLHHSFTAVTSSPLVWGAKLQKLVSGYPPLNPNSFVYSAIKAVALTNI